MHQNALTSAAVLKPLPGNVAVLDAHGVILSVNLPWREFAEKNGMRGCTYGVGRNYLRVCDRARGESSTEARMVAIGIRQVLSGKASNFSMDYPCHSPTEERWFRLIVTALNEQSFVRAVLMHVNITELRKVEERLSRSRTERQMALTSLSRLTLRERQVLGFVIAGRLNKTIASELGTTEKTIKKHRGHMMQKLKIHSVAELVHLSLIAGMKPSCPYIS